MKSFVPLILTGALGLSACASYTRTQRIQPPFYVVPAQTEVALVTVDVPKEVMERAPSDFSNMPGMIAAALPAAFAGSPLKAVDQLSLGYTLEIAPAAPSETTIMGLTVVNDEAPPESQSYVATAPEGLPVGVTAPLVLGTRVLDWRLYKKEVGTKDKPRKVDCASVDIVYSLWSRDGQEVETRRVKVDLAFMTKLAQGVKLLPPRSAAMGMNQTKAFFFGSGAMDRSQLFRQAVEANVMAFAFPFAKHEIPVSAVWDDSSEDVKDGIAKADSGDMKGAVASWQALLQSNPKNSAAHFNLGVAHEIAGEDAEALQAYDRAIGIDNTKGLYTRARGALQARVDLRKEVHLPSAP